MLAQTVSNFKIIFKKLSKVPPKSYRADSIISPRDQSSRYKRAQLSESLENYGANNSVSSRAGEGAADRCEVRGALGRSETERPFLFVAALIARRNLKREESAAAGEEAPLFFTASPSTRGSINCAPLAFE